jgi:hypothetical protein
VQKLLATQLRDLHRQPPQPAESVDSLNPVNQRPLDRPSFASLLMPHPKLLLREWAQAEQELTPSTGSRAIQIGLEQAECLFPAESTGPVDL